MVFFTCNACGESLKKAQVEKHLVICRNSSCLSCIDCGKDFRGDEYKTHLKCISENEKYGGKAFEAKTCKGDKKQQQWIQRIQEVMKKTNITDDMRKILNQIIKYDNVPRKQAKFQNWLKNSLKVFDKNIHEKVWGICAGAQTDDQNKETPKQSSTPAAESKSESSADGTKKKSKRELKEERKKKNKKEKKDLSSEEPQQDGPKKKGKKRKMEEEENNESANNEANDEEPAGKKKKKKKLQDHKGEDVSENGKEEVPRKMKKRNNSQGEEQEEEIEKIEVDENDEEESGNRGKFNWKGTIKALLKEAPDNELPIKKLRKKVIAQYHVISSVQHKSEEEILAIFNKKIQNNPKFRVLKEKVKLVK